VQDFSGICERKPDVCKAGKSALHTIGVKAKAGAKLAYDMLGDDQAAAVADTAPAVEATPDTTIQTGTVAPVKSALVKPKKK
jgi:hypothetical protein